eukprot:2684511-Pleurochrysis_carterae.AAC.1
MFFKIAVRRELQVHVWELLTGLVGIRNPPIYGVQVPRQNGACERQWRMMARDVRAKLATSKLP